MAYKDFQAAQVLTASEVDTYLMNQSVIVFANAAARSAALTSPTEGMLTYLQDSNSFWYYDAAAWTNVGNVMLFASSAARSSAIPSPAEGMITYLQDVDELEVYNGTSWLRVVITSDDEGFTSTGPITSTGTTRTTGLAVGVSGSPARMWSSAGDNFNIRTHTNTPNYNFSLGVQNGSGADSHIPIYFGTGGLTLRGTGTSGGVTVDTSNNVTTTGNVTAANGGADGGIALRPWTASSAYASVATRDMAGAEYMLLSNGLDTFVSAGSTGTSYIRGGANSTTAQLAVGTSYSEFTGRVRFPSQPAVYAHNSGSYTLTDNQVLRFDVVHINRGGHYNGTNSEFTAPLAGLYYVHCQVLTQYNATASDLRIAVNNVRVDAYSGYSLVGGVLSSHKQGHVQGIVSLTAGQYISIKSVGTIDFYGNSGAGHSSLLIHFLG